jgi:hypothetical protein
MTVNTYTIQGLTVPDLEARIEGLRLEMASLRTIVERLDGELGELIKLLEGAEVTAYPLPDQN